MGCTSSTEGHDPNTKKRAGNAPFPALPALSSQHSFKELSELDKSRINLILDYWFDEGPKDGAGYGAGNNSKDYHKIMLNIRQMGELDELTPGGPDASPSNSSVNNQLIQKSKTPV